jgi:ATP-dependent helicase HrpB
MSVVSSITPTIGPDHVAATAAPADTVAMDLPGVHAELPVMSVIGEVRSALDEAGAAVLVAPPGTGKTTAVPPALIDETWAIGGRLLMLEPRRVAARAAARWMADVAGEAVGETFGYAMRGERRVSERTRVEVVTEGLLVRRLQSDPALEGVSGVVLDEFHERSIDTDLALALLLDLRRALRPDLRLLVMSATLDPAPVASLLGDAGPGDGSATVPVIEARAPIHPVEVRYRPGSAHDPWERRAGEVTLEALRADAGDVLVFLPGRPEIRRTRRELERRGLPEGVVIHELHGSLTTDEQDAVIRPDRDGLRRVILATSLAETSITVPGVRVVVDAGRRRSVRTDHRTGLPRLTTTAASRASAQQRSGRAGRTAPGVSYRLWAAEEDRHRPAADEPEVLNGDLAPLVLQVRSWGIDDPSALDWLDPPPGAALVAAAELLRTLGAFDGEGRLTRTGRQLAGIGFHPRLAAVALEGRRLDQQELAADVLAVLETARHGARDIAERVREIRSGRGPAGSSQAVRDWRRTLGGSGKRSGAAGRASSKDEDLSLPTSRLLLAGYPDRVARRRTGTRTDPHGRGLAVFHLRSGGEVTTSEVDDLSRAEWLVVADLDLGPAGRPGSVHLASAIDARTVLDALGESVEQVDEVRWDDERGDLVARRRRLLGAITVADDPLQDPDPEGVARAVREALDRNGPELFGRFAEADGLRARVACLRQVDPGGDWPDWSDAALADRLEEWLGHRLAGIRRRRDLDRLDVRGSLESMLDPVQRHRLGSSAPTHWTLGSGRQVPLRYGEVDGEPGTVLASVRLRDAIGTDDHPVVADGRVRVTVELLSPAGRPVQRTTELSGFWRGSYAAVRSELRGRYPKHPWPERPWEPLSQRRR